MGSLVKARIMDYEIIHDVKLVVEGMTGVVGETNNGKSSIFRALYSAIFNQEGKDYIRQGCTTTAVGVAFEGFPNDNVTFMWKKAASSFYQFNGQPYDKTGRTTPPDIAKAINMMPLMMDDEPYFLNFLEQLEPPLLRLVSESKLYTLIVKSLDGDKLTEAIKIAKKEIDEINERIKADTIELDVHAKNKLLIIKALESYKGLLSIRKEFNEYDACIFRIEKARDLYNKRQLAISSKDKLNQALAAAANLGHFLVVMRNVELLSEKLKRYEDWSNRRKSAIEEQSSVSEKLSKLSWVPELQDVASTIIKLNTDKTKIEGFKKSLDLATRKSQYLNQRIKPVVVGLKLYRSAEFLLVEQATIERVKKYKQENQQSLDEVCKTIEQFEQDLKNNVCPVCKKQKTGDDVDMQEVKKRADALSAQKSQLEGRSQAADQQLKEIDETIRKEGFDPVKLDEEIKGLGTKIIEFETKAQPFIEKLEKDFADVSVS